MTNAILWLAVVLVALSFLWPIQSKRDVVVRAIFFLAGGLIWAINP